MKRVLITGNQGFAGRHLQKRLESDGYDVYGVDDLSGCEEDKTLDPAKNWIGDFSESFVIEEIVERSFDVIVHLAATPRVAYSIEHPHETFDNNVKKTEELIHWAQGIVERFIFASSSSVYGGASDLPTPEYSRPAPKSPYAMHKLIVEQILEQYSMHYGMKNVALRFFNVFGPGALGTSPYSTAVAAWLTAYHTGKPIRFDGNGTQSRDLCYVDNTVDCIARAIEFDDFMKFNVINVACGERTSNNDVYDFLKARYPDIRMKEAPFRAGDVMHTQADITRAKDLLGYEPLVYVKDGLEKTCEWFEEKFKK